MKISTNKKIENGVYIAAIAVTDFSENDRKLISKFGEPELELGGHFAEVPAVPSYTDIELTANPAVGEYVTVDDGANAVTFEFSDGVAALVNPAATPVIIEVAYADTQSNLMAAILAETSLDIASIDHVIAAPASRITRTGTVLNVTSTTDSVSVGITNTALVPAVQPAYDLPTNLRRIKADSPHVAKFDSRDETSDDVARDKANVWVRDMTVRIKEAMDALRANDDGYTGETLETY